MPRGLPNFITSQQLLSVDRSGAVVDRAEADLKQPNKK
jgi:hypothetical protein